METVGHGFTFDPKDPVQFRTAVGRFPSGVVAVTGSAGQQLFGLTIQSFASVSLDPPMILVCPATSSTSWPRIAETGNFCVNVLQYQQQEVCRALATSGSDKFRDVAWTPSPKHGNPVLVGSAVWFDCVISDVVAGGDHSVVLARVETAGSGEHTSDPLIFHTSTFGKWHSQDLNTPPRLAN